MASLFVIRGKDVGRHILLRNDCTGVGRDADNELQLQDTEVSRHHAAIIRLEDHFEIKDLGSSNGTFLNSVRVQQQPLKSGDRLQIGRTLLVFTGSNELPGDFKHAESSAPFGVDIIGTPQVAEVSRIRKRVPSDLASVSSVWKTKSESSDQPQSSGVTSEKSQWEVVYRTALAVSRTLDINQLVAQILDLIFQSIDCDRGCIMLIDEETRALQPVCRKNRNLSSHSDRMQISQTILDYAIENNEGVYTSNAQEDGRWDSAASLVSQGVLEAICVPMQGRYGVVGAIYIDTSTSPGKYVERGGVGRFNEDHLKLMIAIGNQAALAVEDSTYYRGMVQSERLAVMGQTIANLSHHIKNILQGIRGGSYLVSDGLQKQDLDIVGRGWRIVERNQDRIAALVMDMLTFSKDRIPSLKPSDVRLMIDDVVELLQSRASEVQVELQWHRPEQFPLVELDAEAMHRAVLNVLGNAIDAVQNTEGGRVSIRVYVQAEQNRVSIEIEDNGSGVPEDQKQKIFSVFESSKGSRGTGLGLPVSRKIMREHGGDIELRDGQEQGACFVLWWPIQSASPQPLDINRPTAF
ncbi:MAG: ATP-binding protein [Pirellulales bacterium]